MAKKLSMMVCLGDEYGRNSTGYPDLSFVYKNVTDFQTYLSESGAPWKNYLSIPDEAATKANIIAKFQEVLADIQDSDWMIFYYTGHGAQYNPGIGLSSIKTYCVTYSPELRYNYFPGIDHFLSEDDYLSLVQSFGAKAPNGHLITILDCCNAAGMVDSFAQAQPYHTLIAATSKFTSAYYNTNSSFFYAFSQAWTLPLNQIEDAVNTSLAAMGAPNSCVVKLAPGFATQTL